MLQTHDWQQALLDDFLVPLHNLLLRFRNLLAHALLILAHHLLKGTCIQRHRELLRGADGAGGADAPGGDPLVPGGIPARVTCRTGPCRRSRAARPITSSPSTASTKTAKPPPLVTAQTSQSRSASPTWRRHGRASRRTSTGFCPFPLRQVRPTWPPWFAAACALATTASPDRTRCRRRVGGARAVPRAANRLS